MWLRMAANKIKMSFCTRGGRIEWIGVILALPFALAAFRLGGLLVVARSPFSYQSAHYISGAFFTAGMALGIYATAWALAATEAHQRLAAYSAVMDAMACLALAIVIEWYFYARLPGERSLVIFMIPAGIWVIATLLLLPAAKAKKNSDEKQSVDVLQG